MTFHRHRQILRALAQARRLDRIAPGAAATLRPWHFETGINTRILRDALHALEHRAFEARADGFLRHSPAA